MLLKSNTRFRNLAEAGLMRRACNLPLDDEQTAAVKHAKLSAALNTTDRSSFNFDLGLMDSIEHQRFKNSLSTLDGSQGAYLIPSEELLPTIEHALDLHSAIRSVATVRRQKMGNDSGEVMIDDASAEGYDSCENESKTASEIEFKKLNFRPLTFRSGILTVPYAMIEDGLESVSSALSAALGRRIARRMNRVWTSQLVAEATAVTTGVAAGAVDYDDLVSVIDAVGAAYRSSPSFGIMLHPNVMTLLWQGKDGNGAPMLHLMRDFGVRFVLNPHLDSTVAAGKISLVAGDFSQLHVLDDSAVKIQSYFERSATADQVDFQARLKAGFTIATTSGQPAFAKIVH